MSTAPMSVPYEEEYLTKYSSGTLLTWSGVYPSSTLSNALLRKVLALVPLTSTGSEFFVATMTTFLSDYYYYLEETLTHMKSIKLKSYPGKNVTDFCTAILVEAERLESSGAFEPEHLGYITLIFEDTYGSRFRLLVIHKYKEVT